MVSWAESLEINTGKFDNWIVIWIGRYGWELGWFLVYSESAEAWNRLVGRIGETEYCEKLIKAMGGQRRWVGGVAVMMTKAGEDIVLQRTGSRRGIEYGKEIWICWADLGLITAVWEFGCGQKLESFSWGQGQSLIQSAVFCCMKEVLRCFKNFAARLICFRRLWDSRYKRRTENRQVVVGGYRTMFLGQEHPVGCASVMNCD